MTVITLPRSASPLTPPLIERRRPSTVSRRSVGYVPIAVDIVGERCVAAQAELASPRRLQRAVRGRRVPEQACTPASSGVGDEQEPSKRQPRTLLGRRTFVNIDAPRGWRAGVLVDPVLNGMLGDVVVVASA